MISDNHQSYLNSPSSSPLLDISKQVDEQTSYNNSSSFKSAVNLSHSRLSFSVDKENKPLLFPFNNMNDENSARRLNEPKFMRDDIRSPFKISNREEGEKLLRSSSFKDKILGRKFPFAPLQQIPESQTINLMGTGETRYFNQNMLSNQDDATMSSVLSGNNSFGNFESNSNLKSNVKKLLQSQAGYEFFNSAQSVESNKIVQQPKSTFNAFETFGPISHHQAPINQFNAKSNAIKHHNDNDLCKKTPKFRYLDSTSITNCVDVREREYISDKQMNDRCASSKNNYFEKAKPDYKSNNQIFNQISIILSIFIVFFIIFTIFIPNTQEEKIYCDISDTTINTTLTCIVCPNYAQCHNEKMVY